MSYGDIIRLNRYREFLNGEQQTCSFISLNPSSFAATFAGKTGGYPTLDDEVAFHKAFPNDSMIALSSAVFPDLVPTLKWQRKCIEKKSDGSTIWQETIRIPTGIKTRVVAEQPGTTNWLMEPAVKSYDDFDLIDFYSTQITEHATIIAADIKKKIPEITNVGLMAGAVILSAFEMHYLIDYPDMPLFYIDNPLRYMESVKRVHANNLALLDAFAGTGIEIIFTGSAGLELLSPQIFREAIVPFQREFNDYARSLKMHSCYHICGHSRQLIEMKIIDQIKPTIFETCSSPPCGNNLDLRKAVFEINEEIITKGNLPLELLLEGTPAKIMEAVHFIKEKTAGRRHIIGQADATILDGTPHENIRAFIQAAQ